MKYNPHNEAVNTRRLYKFENEYFPTNHRLVKQRSVHSLQKLAQRIWDDDESMPEKAAPLVRFGIGWYKYSWTDGEVIELCAGQCDQLTLIHEMTHCFGEPYHDGNFVNLYIDLLVTYTRVSYNTLLTGLDLYKVEY